MNLEQTTGHPPGRPGRRPLVERTERATVGQATVENPRMSCRNVSVYYDSKKAISNISLDIGRNEVIAMIGPSGCGKSTFLRCLNRMNDTIDGCLVTGQVLMDGKNIYDSDVDVVPLRAQVGMVSKSPIPFLNPSTTTLPTALEYTVLSRTGTKPMSWLWGL